MYLSYAKIDMLYLKMQRQERVVVSWNMYGVSER